MVKPNEPIDLQTQHVFSSLNGQPRKNESWRVNFLIKTTATKATLLRCCATSAWRLLVAPVMISSRGNQKEFLRVEKILSFTKQHLIALFEILTGEIVETSSWDSSPRFFTAHGLREIVTLGQWLARHQNIVGGTK